MKTGGRVYSGNRCDLGKRGGIFLIDLIGTYLTYDRLAMGLIYLSAFEKLRGLYLRDRMQIPRFFAKQSGRLVRV